MPLMSKKKQPFIIDHDLGVNLKPYLPAVARTTVECGLRANAPDYPDVVDLCQREIRPASASSINFFLDVPAREALVRRPWFTAGMVSVAAQSRIRE
jgi:hypothetical protein